MNRVKKIARKHYAWRAAEAEKLKKASRQNKIPRKEEKKDD